MTVLKIGSKLQSGKYEITRVLGSGNFGITYLASTKIAVKGQMGQMDVTINVAIKEFYMKDLNNRTLDGTTVEGTQNTMVKNYRHKFRKEAENLAKLHHPNIIKVIEVFDENNTTYYVMEYIEGGSLDDYIKQKGHLSEDEALRCTIEIGKALSYMHKNWMIHLDLKPKNVMRNPNGILFLIDFGLSKQYDENGEPESSTSIGLGTPGYAPLEQANYKQDGTLPVTIDVYSLGATFFKMLTGKTPPEASSVLNEGLPLKALKHTGVSAGTISIVEKAMSPMKKERYQTVSSMSEAISTLSDGNEQTIYEQEKESLKYNEEAEVKVENSHIENSINHKIGVNSNIPWKRKIGGVKIAQMTGLGIVVLLVLLCTINNAPLENGYHIGSNIWNIGIVGLCSSILFRIYYIFTKKKIWGLISIGGLILSLIFLFFLILNIF
ncbi:MAG: serine/threonine protein kinase [Prevotella sp.]|nr:serine/threonine protein kinase [Prevotella sp.]